MTPFTYGFNLFYLLRNFFSQNLDFVQSPSVCDETCIIGKPRRKTLIYNLETNINLLYMTTIRLQVSF